MLEARLLAKLARAELLWEMGYINDAQDELKDVLAIATDTPWEERIEFITTEGCISYDDLKTTFLANHPGVTENQLHDNTSIVYLEWQIACKETDRQWNELVKGKLEMAITDLYNSIADKVHRRNLQIADLKRQLEQACSGKTIAEHRAMPGIETL